MESSRALLLMAVTVAAIGLAGANFRDDCDIPWAPENAYFSPDGHSLTMSLPRENSGCALQTKKQFIYGSVSTLIKLIPGDSAGTVTTYYTSSAMDSNKKHDEIDFEFLGNETGQPYTIHTNIFVDGVGNREMQFVPWFNATDGYHNYTISWTPCMVVWYVDSVPIRVFRNFSKEGVPFPVTRPMYAYSTLWEADDWATQGGRVKTNWANAPFVASYQDMVVDVCSCASGDYYCADNCKAKYYGYDQQYYCGGLQPDQAKAMLELQQKYRIYDYCVKYRAANKECDLQQY
ncbi:probable xyloglucan endotransglucosylase/hydrolase protein 12 [Brachypodium distachyon]|uniref:GH16 domain-containing protein n=1 Tax=Brachypodium distachyon TaxID=15368 RepID=I1HZI9_BRADI|nr:probable xyloglucan endotransglucosylase/hydrolase protein 12 [Brachypodium distachyon]KQJ94401.1 hypothetical protein BRADI_3g10310v3 [Brachypodium distachyon]|eukprot:XP_003571203.1 probable xyloglucan endotransglucosylase/hydrolase protein 12 [Brachypodium distachyon]